MVEPFMVIYDDERDDYSSLQQRIVSWLGANLADGDTLPFQERFSEDQIVAWYLWQFIQLLLENEELFDVDKFTFDKDDTSDFSKNDTRDRAWMLLAGALNNIDGRKTDYKKLEKEYQK